MSHLQPQPNHDPVIQDFYRWIEDVRKPDPEQRKWSKDTFVPRPRITEYFKDLTRVTKLLRTVFGSEELPVSPARVADACPRVFSILLLIGKGNYIRGFVEEHSLWDEELPFRSQPPGFPRAPDDPSFFKSFHEFQWQFCAPKLHNSSRLHFDDDIVLPIVRREPIASGVSANVFKIELHEWYNRLHKDADSQATNNPLRNIFVLKTYCTPDAEKYYESEVEAFRKLNTGRRHEPNLIGFYGSYIQHGTYNLVLQFADRGTLEDYFSTVCEPVRGEDIISFWRNLFGIITALIAIHGVPPDRSSGPQILQGWHQDVKPANILVLSRGSASAYDFQFKLADLGLSHFKSTVALQTNIVAKDTRGTRAYGAPECYRPDDEISDWDLDVRQHVDIWSLGCVYSEADTWIVGGYHGRAGVQEYRQQRMAATNRIRGFQEGDCFHDGEKVLDVVRTWHQELSGYKRGQDHITDILWSKMLEEMLGVPDIRPSARQLWEKSKIVLQEAECKLTGQSLGAPARARTSAPAMPSQAFSERPRAPPQIPPDQSPNQNSVAVHRWQSSYSEDVIDQQQANHYTSTSRSAITSSPDSLTTAGRGSPQMRSEPIPTLTPMPPPMHHDTHSIPYRLSAHETPPAAEASDRTHRDAPHLPSRAGKPAHSSSVRHHQRHARIGTGESQPASINYSATMGSTQNQNAYQHEHHTSDASVQSAQSIQVTRPAHSPTSPITQTVLRNEPTSPAQPKPLPHMTVDTLHRWKEDMKKYKQSNLLTDDQYLEEVKKRDHVFLVDDSESMRKHWTDLKRLFGDLVYLTKDCDPDGVELYFMTSEDWKKSRETTPLLNMLELKTYRLRGNSNAARRIDFLLQRYKHKLDHGEPRSLRNLMGGPARPQNLYILTDGVWQEICDVATPIRSLVDKLESKQSPMDQVGIQFIQFGNEPTGTERLELLDSGLGLARDIVDTEPSNGNVWKMLLGSINKWFDQDLKTISK